MKIFTIDLSKASRYAVTYTCPPKAATIHLYNWRNDKDIDYDAIEKQLENSDFAEAKNILKKF